MNWKIVILTSLFTQVLPFCGSRIQPKGTQIHAGIPGTQVPITAMSEAQRISFVDSVLNYSASDSDGFRQSITIFEPLFADPNSSIRNETVYARILKAMIQSKWYGIEAKEKARYYLLLLAQNCVGCFANDFSFIIPKGDKKKLYSLSSKFTLLFFYNPECEACKEMKEAILQSWYIRNSTQSKNLEILAIYIGKDIEIWKKHLTEQPTNWLQGRDENEFLYRNGVYDLKAIPTLYLLDWEKKVLLKDVVDVYAIDSTLQVHENIIQPSKHHE